MREQRARYMSNDSTLASYSEPGSCYEEMLRYISHLYRKLTRRLQRIYSGWHRLDMSFFIQSGRNNPCKPILYSRSLCCGLGKVGLYYSNNIII